MPYHQCFMKIAVDLTPLLGPRTGIGRVVEEVAARLGQRPGVEPTGVLISMRGWNQFAAVIGEGWQSRRMPVPARACHQLWRRTDRPSLTGYDVVHGLNYVVPPAGGGAELVAVHDLTAWKYPELVDAHSRYNPILLRRAVSRGAHVHTGSQYVADEIVADLGVPAERVHTIVNGHTPSAPGEAGAGRALVGGAPYALAIGTIEPRKDYVGLVRAMNQVWDELPDLHLVIVGQAGWGADAVRLAIEQCRCPDKVHRLGYVSEGEKADLLAGASTLVYPSLYEGFGFPLLEAMEARAPIVSTMAGSIPEVVGDAAVLVTPGDSDQLGQAIVEVIGDTAGSELRIKRGRERLGLYDWEMMVDQLEVLYRRLSNDQLLDRHESSPRRQAPTLGSASCKVSHPSDDWR